MTFHSIVRQWCRTYKPMLDSATNGNRRFYLTDSMSGYVEIAKKIANSLSPCVVMESTVEGVGTIARPNRNYPVYFFVRARDMADGDAAAEAKEEAWVHAQRFLSWLLRKHDREMEMNIDGDFSRISIDDYIDYQTVGPIENGWFGVMIQLERAEPLNMCVDEDLYTDGGDCLNEDETPA